MRKRISVVLFILLQLAGYLTAESKWEIYSTYKAYTQLEEYHDQLYVRSGNAVFVTDKSMDQTATLTQLSGLSSSSIQFIAKCEKADALLFIHQDGAIDIMNEDKEFSSIHDLKNKTSIGDKTIHSYTICGDKCYLACGFGFVEIDIRNQVITGFHTTEEDCQFAFKFADGIYYATSENGLLRCDEGKNYSVKSNWKQITGKKLLDVTVFDHDDSEQCWIIDEDKYIHILNPDGTYKKSSSRNCYERLKKSGNYVFSKGWGFDIIDADTQEVSFVQDNHFGACRDYYAESDSILFVVHPEYGLLKLAVSFQPNNHAEIRQSAETNHYFEMAGSQINELAFSNEVLAGISGYKMYAAGYTEMCLANAAVNYFQEGEWNHVTEEQVQSQPLAAREFRGLTDIAADPLVKNRFYVSTLTTGIYQFDSDSVTKHFFPKDRFTAVSSDSEGNLWAAKAFSDTTIWAYDRAQDKWLPHFIAGFSNQPNIGRIIIQDNDPHQLIWTLNNYPYRNSRIGVLYNPNGVADNQHDQSANISTLKDQDGNLYSLSNTISYIYDIQEDEDGKMWILTNMGPFIIEDVVSTFNYAQKNVGIGLVKRIKVPRNDGTNLADYLLANTTCTAMVTDRNNQKWIGTLEEGIYLLSPDGLREITHYTTENSPLPSNNITSLAYDHLGQRLFIACDGGLVVYHTEDLEPSEDFSSFYCYPNPLRPDYYGDVEIKGLMENTQVSITDSAGNLIWKALCEDGNASWNGRDADGKRVAPGVYFVHAISQNTSKGEIFKLLVL